MNNPYGEPADRDNRPWPERGNCHQHPEPDLWYGLPDGITDREQHATNIQTAKAICGTCPVKTQCFTYARHAQEPAGVWGGIDFGNPDERNNAGLPRYGRTDHTHKPDCPNCATDLDETAIQIALKHGGIKLPTPELHAAIIRGTRRGLSADLLSARLGVTGRSIQRHRATHHGKEQP